MIDIREEEQQLLVDFKNSVPETFYHCLRVKKLVCKMVKVIHEAGILDFTPEQMNIICKGAMLHDIGKINIDNRILTQPGGLTDKEKERIQKHTIVGCELIDGYLSSEEKEIIKNICLNHHERVDGNGYYGKTDINDYVQIISICDVYDALSSDRVYREGLDADTAIGMIEKGACGAFSEWLIDSLKKAVMGEK